MSQGAGRNDLCPCGSGQKMKHCHPEGYKKSSGNRNLVIFGVAAAVLLIAVVVISRDDTPARVRTQATSPVQSSTIPQSGTPATQGGGTPQPPGPAPEGKVWSAEHGHWHDAPASQPRSTTVNRTPNVSVTPGNNNQPVAQPPGPAPEGKVWSAEHGHWHDAPAAAPQPVVTPAPAATEGTGP